MHLLGISLILAFTLLTAATVIARIFFSHEICWPILQAWATREGVEIEHENHDLLFEDFGPFRFRHVNTQRVYCLRVTQNGRTRTAYARCGHWLLGLLKPTLTIRWKDE